MLSLDLVVAIAAVVTVAIACCTAVVDAVEYDGSSHVRNATLDSSLDIFWTIDSDLETIRIAVHAKDASGWAGLGMSEMGGMEGADIVFYETATDSVTDAHSIIPGRPVTDECNQDWNLLFAEADGDGLVFEVERALDTGDTQDRAFGNDSVDGALPTRLLAAWGDEDVISYHGFDFAKGEVIVFGGMENSDPDPISDISSSPSVASFDVTSKDFLIPAQRTWYEETCFNASQLPQLDEYHIIGFEGLVQNETAEYVHHLLMTAYYDVGDCGYSCNAEMDAYAEEADRNASRDTSSPTDTVSSPRSSSSYSSTSSGTPFTGAPCKYTFSKVFIWTPGSSNFEMPDDLGFEQFSSIAVEVHYNNPNEDRGMVDSSGVPVYYTEELRPINMGVLSLADPFVLLQNVLLPSGKSMISFTCPSSCTENYFEEESVTVYAHFQHMHESGQLMQTRQYRNDSDGIDELVHVAEVEYYSFLQAGAHVTLVGDGVTIQKGDRFETACSYDTSYSSVDPNNVTFGFGSEQEMCIDFVFYYPRQLIPYGGTCGLGICGGTVDFLKELEDDSDFNRTFGSVADICVEELIDEAILRVHPGAETVICGK